MESQNFVQIVEMTDEEKFEMYIKVSHEELVRMKIESEKYEKMMEKERCLVCYNRTCVNRIPFCNNQYIEENMGTDV